MTLDASARRLPCLVALADSQPANTPSSRQRSDHARQDIAIGSH